jgi:N-succinyldiaminopimelate aminotransferase
MPTLPPINPTIAAMPGSIYSGLTQRLAQFEGQTYPLHVGDTFMSPLPAAQMEAQREADHPGLHRYTPPQGLPALVDGLTESLRTRGLSIERSGVLVTAGATAGLAAVMGALLVPGDEVMILAPFWPLIRGHVRCFGGVAVEVPFFDRVQSIEQGIAALDAAISNRTKALYVSTPSNPTGRVLPGDWLQAIAAWARAKGIWLISDETYEHYVFDGEHVHIGRFAPERTITAFSFSKAYGMAGNRVGYLAGPASIIGPIQKVATHTYYCAPRAGQAAALVALEQGDDWIAHAHAQYRDAGRRVASVLGLPAPQGSTFLFLNLEGRVDARGVNGFLSDLVDNGVLMAPGPSFGQDYHQWVRLCFSSVTPAQAERAAGIVKACLD